MKRVKRAHRGGAVLIVVLGVLVVLSILAIAFGRLTSLERAVAGQHALGVHSEFAAHAGVERAVAELQRLTADGTLAAPGAAWRYHGEDANRNGVFDGGEDTNANGAFEIEECALRYATAPSFQDPSTLGLTDPIQVHSGRITLSPRTEARYVLEVVDASGLIDLNSRQSNLARLLVNLGLAIDSFDPPIDAQVAQRILAYRDGSLGGRFFRKEQLKDVPAVTPDAYDRIEGFLTTFGRSDPMLLRSERRDVRLVQDRDDANDDLLRAVIEPRMVVNVNAASRPVLQALFDGIEAWYVEAPGRAVFPNVPTNPNRDPDDGGPVRISRDEARRLAEAMIQRRESAGPFDSWKAVFDFLGSPQAQNAFTGSADLRLLKGDTVFANLNPNTDSWRFNPNRCWGSLNRRGPGDSYVVRGVDKFDLVGADGITPTFTTEGSLDPSGVFEITSLGRVVETDSNRVVAQSKIRAVIRIFDAVRLSTQADFEGTSPRLTGSSGPATHRQDLIISGESTKNQVQTYPEFDPRSWRSTIPQWFTGADGYLVSGQRMPALYDGQIMLGVRHLARDPALFVYAPFEEDGDNANNDFRNVIPGGGLGMFGNDLIEQRSLIEPETQQLNASSVTHVSNSPTTIPRFERDANLQPDGIQFVSRRGLVHGGGSLPGRGSIQFWAKPIFATHDDREDDLIMMERNGRGDPLYSPGFNANGHGNISPALFCDWTMNGHILGLWQTFYPANYTHFIMQNSLTYEWHSAVLSRPIQRGEWVLVTGVFDATHSQLFINSEQAIGPDGSAFNLTQVFSTNWGIWSSRVKPAIAHSTMGDLRALRETRSEIDVGIDYLEGRYHSSGSWTSPLLEIPGGRDVRFLGIEWTELVPDPLSSGSIELSVDVEPGAGFAADAGPFTDASGANRIGATGRRFRIRADLSAQPMMGQALIETPVLDDITIFFDRGQAEILSWETLPE